MKTRIWKCPCCKTYWRRRKGDYKAPHCSVCNTFAVKARTYPSGGRPCVHNRLRMEGYRVQERVWSIPRCASGHALALTPNLRRTWAACRKAKTRPALIRRGQAWIDALNEESERREGMIKTVDNRMYVHEARTNFGESPRVIRRPESAFAGLLGEYSHDITCQDTITVATGRPLDDVRETLIHEALHFLDALANIRGCNHDRLWRLRLDRMRILFPVQAFGHTK